MKADLIFLTEIQLVDSSYKELLKKAFVDHDLYLHNSSDKLKHLASYIEKNGLDVCLNVLIMNLFVAIYLYKDLRFVSFSMSEKPLKDSKLLQIISNMAHNEKKHVEMLDFILIALASSISELVSHLEQTQCE